MGTGARFLLLKLRSFLPSTFMRRRRYIGVRRVSTNYGVMSDQVAKRPGMKGGNVDEVQRDTTSSKTAVCNLGTQKFSEIVNVAAFVDKTLFIKEFLETPHKVIATFAPRRFGKSTLMDMVVEFLSRNMKLFQDNNLKIWKEETAFFYKYCQQNPVIYLDFGKIGGITIDDTLEDVKVLISEAFQAHKYLIKVVEGKYSWSDPKLEKVAGIGMFQHYWAKPYTFTRSDIVNGLMKLCHLLHVFHGKPVYVFTDDYDHPIMNLIMNSKLGKEDLNKILEIIGMLVSNLFKNNDHMKRGLIMGCVRIAETLSGDADNIQYYEFLREPGFSRYFGFTAEEVDSLLNKDEFIPFKNDQFKEWYNGYIVTDSENSPAIYSCISVLNYLKKSKDWNKPHFERYWVDTGSIHYVKDLCNYYTKTRSLIHSLVNNKEVQITTVKKFDKQHVLTLQNWVQECSRREEADLFLQFLAENGYLNVVSYDAKKATSIIRSPNMEINMLLREKI